MFCIVKNIINYIKNSIKLVMISYDSESDVLYMSFGNPKPCKSIDIGNGIVVRKTPNGELNGITIIDYKKRIKRSN